MSNISIKKSFSIHEIYKYTTLIIFMGLNCIYSQNGINIVANGEFDNGSAGWYLTKTGNANASITTCSDTVLSGIKNLKVDIKNGGDSLGAVRLRQSINMQTGRYYKVFFMAKANRPCKIQPCFNINQTSPITIWKGNILNITNSAQHFGPFIYKNELPQAVRAFSFFFGNDDSTTIRIDSVIVEMIDDPDNVRPDEALVQSLKDSLNRLISFTDNKYLKLHFNCIINVIESPDNLLMYSYNNLNGLFTALTDTTIADSPRKLSSYLNRTRPFIVAWTSPTDGKVSFALALPPKDWDSLKAYPLYVSLHGLWNVADNPIDYLSIYLSPGSTIHEPYEDGYLLMPWGRGNLWYEGISETDVWECIAAFESIVKVDQSRKYLTGHSMGGYGAWKIGQGSAGTWAALGIHAGALWYDSRCLNDGVIQKLKRVPIYFVVGDQDGLLSINQQAYQLLQDAGDKNLYFTTFSGGHDYLYENVKGMNDWIKNFTLDSLATDISENNSLLPSEFRLNQNYPNPFNPSTVISYSIPVGTRRAVFVQLKIFDVLGREVATLVNKEQSAGKYEIRFSAGSFGDGINLSSGVYLYKLCAGGFVQTKKMMLLK